ncbi:MAG: hypothetical protein J6K58_04790 [Lachnospiraceae bacterium]|nr:hypothetical protein [Lachnospiraceae bacterium]
MSENCKDFVCSVRYNCLGYDHDCRSCVCNDSCVSCLHGTATDFVFCRNKPLNNFSRENAGKVVKTI